MVRPLLTLLLLAGLLSACDDDPAEKQNQTEHAADPVDNPTRKPSASEAAGPYHLITELGYGAETVESIDLCSLVERTPEVVAAVVAYAGPIGDSHVDQHACVLVGVRDGKERTLQIVVTTDPSTTLEDSFGIDSRGYRYQTGPCLVTPAGYRTGDGLLAGAAECSQDVWVAVATPAYPDADAAQVNAVLEAAIKNL